MEVVSLIGKLIWFFLPAGVANMAPVITAKLLPSWSAPISQRWLGTHKTWRGLCSGIVAGGVFFWLQLWLLNQFPGLHYWWAYDVMALPWYFGFGLGAGALIGDSIKSFFKHLLGIKPGSSWVPFDQLDYTVLPLLFAMLFVTIPLTHALVAILVAFILHWGGNLLGFTLNLKDRPW